MKNKIQTIAIITSMLIPLPTSALGVKADDTVAGLGTVIQISGITPGTDTEVIVIPPFGPEITGFADSSGTVSISGKDTESAGHYRVEVYEEGNLKTTGSFEVLPDNMDPYESSIQSDFPALEPDGEDAVKITVILRDRYSNPLPGRTVGLIPGRTSDIITNLSNETDSGGAQAFEVSTYEPGEISLRAMDMVSGELIDGAIKIQAGAVEAVGGYYPAQVYEKPLYGSARQSTSGYSGPESQKTHIRSPADYGYPGNYMPYTVRQYPYSSAGQRAVGSILGRELYGQAAGFGVASGFRIEISPELEVNEDTTIRITAIDQNDIRVEDYTGTAMLSSTDPNALLPLEGQIKFQPQNLGEKVLTLGLRFRTAGEQILHVEDSVDPNINAQVYINVLGEGGVAVPTLNITSHKQDQVITETEVTLEGEGPPFMNLVVTGGIRDERGETDQNGKFSIEVLLNENMRDHTLRVKDESGRYDSGNIHLVLDRTPPEIGTITFDPVEPISGDTSGLTVITAGEARRVTAEIAGKEYELSEKASESGAFTLSFDAPEPGTHQPVIKAYDAGGNSSEVLGNIVVREPGLPKVENVTAKQESDGSVILSWDPLDDMEIDSYRIYVGDDPNNFLYTLETEHATATASVAGLNPKTSYYFAVTALEGERESEQKSDTVEITTEGFSLEITPQDGAILIEWEPPAKHTTLSAYILEYGAGPDAYTEQRTISGDLRTFVLRDLINGVTYFIRLTPVSVTGEALREIAAEGTGTPAGPLAEFNPSPAQGAPEDMIKGSQKFRGPISDSLNDDKKGYALHSGAPSTPSTGLPVWTWIGIGVFAILFYMHWHRQRTLRIAMEFMRQMDSKYRNG